MKQKLILLLLVLLPILINAQNDYQDIIYLKNGSIIKGTITEQIPNKTIKIKTENNIFVYKMEEVEKITNNEKSLSTKKKSKKYTKQKGYIGVSAGINIPIGSFSDLKEGRATTGFQLNPIQFGYMFSDKVGITATWFKGANTIDIETGELLHPDGSELTSYTDPWIYNSLLIGPLFSFPFTENIDFDVKPMIGMAVASEPYEYQKSSAFSFDLGTALRIGVSEKFALTFGIDYFNTKPYFEKIDVTQSISVITINGGVVYKLK